MLVCAVFTVLPPLRNAAKSITRWGNGGVGNRKSFDRRTPRRRQSVMEAAPVRSLWGRFLENLSLHREVFHRNFFASQGKRRGGVFFLLWHRQKTGIFCRLCLVVYLVYLVVGAKKRQKAVLVRVRGFFVKINYIHSVHGLYPLCARIISTLCTD